MSEQLDELTDRLEALVVRLRTEDLAPQQAINAVEECAALAAEASTTLDRRSRAAVEPLPDLPGQLPLPAPV